MKISIGGTTYDKFAEYNIQLIYNAIASSFSFTGLKDFIDDILYYPDVQIFDDNDNLILTGTLLIPEFNVSEKPELTELKGYSITGVLEDCNLPLNSLQSDNLSLKQITDKLLSPFDLEYLIDPAVESDISASFKKTNAGPETKIKEFLNELAAQKNIIISNDEYGRLVYTRLDISKLKPVAVFEEGNPGIIKMNFPIDGQAMHSDITIVKQASGDNADAGEYTIKNPYVSRVYRPTTKVLSSGDIFDIRKAARMELANEIATMVLTIETTKFVKPGNLITAKSEGCKIKDYTNFFVQETTIEGNIADERYKLKCVLPDVYTDADVKSIFDGTQYVTKWQGKGKATNKRIIKYNWAGGSH